LSSFGEADIRRLFDSLVLQERFTRRPLSWVAVTDDLFFKVPRRSNDVLTDATDHSVLTKAAEEYRVLVQLSEITPHVLRPVGVVSGFGCLVMHRINGQNARDILRNGSDKTVIAQTVLAGIDVCASLHTCRRFPASLHPYDYSADPFADVLSMPPSRPIDRATLVIDGFEIRNILVRTIDKFPIFFDPHQIAIGYPEDDLARYVVSLLMVSWGRGGLRVWREFSTRSLIETYQKQANISIDAERMGYFLKRTVRMREYYARESERRLPLPIRGLGALYRSSFFHQIKDWIAEHDF